MASSASGQRPTLHKLRSWSSHYNNSFPKRNTNALNNADVLHNTLLQQEEEPTIIKPITFLHGEPTTMWTTKEFDRSIVRLNLQFALVAIFSYGTDLYELRKVIPIQLEIKGPCNIGFREDRHILIRLSRLEDYATLMSKACE